jgi:hypothetical protein
MELGKYKLAMRPKKYLTREFVVYKAAPEAMDDVITEEQNTIDTMPSQAPAMDNYMPEIPGMEDPSLRQVELADGGVVQREEFAKGSEPVFASEKEIESFKKEMKKKYPGLGVSEGLTSGGKRQIRIRYAKRFGSERKPAFERNRYLIPTKKNLQILREDAASFVKEAKEKGFEIISDPYELRAKQGLEKTKDQQKLFNDILEKVKQEKNFKYDTLAEKEIYRKLSTNIYKHNSEVGRNLGEGVPFLRNILEEDVDKVLNKINNLPGLRDLNRGDIQYLIRQSYPAGSKQRLEAFKNFKNYERVATKVRNKFGLQFQLEHPLSRKAIERSGAGGIKESLLRVKAVPKVFNDFKNKYDTRLNEIQRNLLDPTLRPQASEQLKSLNQIGKLMFEGYDVGELTSTGKVKRYGSDPFIKTDLVEGLKQSLNLNNQVKQNVIKYKPQLTPLFESAGLSPKILARGEKLAPIAKQTQILNFIEKLNPTEKKVISNFSNFGNKLSMGFDPTDALKMLPEKEYEIMKRIISKGAKLGLKGATLTNELLLLGSTPLGAAVAVGAEGFLPAKAYLQGATGDEIFAESFIPYFGAKLLGKDVLNLDEAQQKALLDSALPGDKEKVKNYLDYLKIRKDLSENILEKNEAKKELENAPKGVADIDLEGLQYEYGKANQKVEDLTKQFYELKPKVNISEDMQAFKRTLFRNVGDVEYRKYKRGLKELDLDKQVVDTGDVLPKDKKLSYENTLYDLINKYTEGTNLAPVFRQGDFPSETDIFANIMLGKSPKQIEAEREAAIPQMVSPDDLINEYAYGGRVGLAAGTIPRAVNWVAKRIQDINKLIKTKRAKAEDFLDEIEILNKAEELNLTKEQVGQILRQQKQAATEKYLKRPIEGDPDLESRLPYDPNATPGNIKKRKNVYGKYKFTGNESLEDLYELERLGKITRMDMNVYDPRYVEWLDAQIINKEELYTPKEWENTPEVLKNKMRGRIDPDWETANFGEDFDWDRARSTEIQQTQKLKDFDVTGRSKNSSGGRVGLEKGGDPKDKPILPINPMIGGEDPSRLAARSWQKRCIKRNGAARSGSRGRKTRFTWFK